MSNTFFLITFCSFKPPVSDSDDSDDDGVDFDFDKLGPIDINPAEHKLQVSSF